MLDEVASEDQIIVVEDEPTQRLFIDRVLSRAGYPVHTAANARDGYRLALAVAPTLILLDIGLPDMDGLSLCRRLRTQTALQAVPILILTAQSDSETIVDAFDAGAVDYVVKPFKSAVLLARVATHCRLGHLSRQMRRGLDASSVERDRLLRRMRELNARMALAEQRHQRELAQALHDSPLQKLSLVKTLLDTTQARLKATEPADCQAMSSSLIPPLDRSLQLLAETLSELRTLCFDLGRPLLHQAGLTVAVQALALRTAEQWGFACAIKTQGDDTGLDEQILETMYQAVRELLNNIGKHAAAAHGELHLTIEPDLLSLIVRDDGVGISPANHARAGMDAEGGFGLLSLRSRVELLGGSLILRRCDPCGTEARLLLPLGIR
ncbi:MAG TPA: hypothetical protein DDY14_10935 [Chromatiaceae bacterium]|jgi:signal transduction histidine kinase|nr:MAG: hypothetical protein N838_02595 [Thiohalocapsa sp. PB-PSB1]QQO52837.1 MAG: response regulator [Thiohalocapsa sp. PB-PSB1]HBG95808.1 hypothetical protein [Chromatiaceae bacterium]HCS91368.1 hypothetical protein [Chromatiaceae bacterium]